MSARNVVLLAIAGAGIALAQHASDCLYPIRDGRKFGFINRSGTVVVQPQYDAVGECREGRIRVTVGSLSGYMDTTGKLVIEARYDTAGEFKNERAVVRMGDKYELIDPAGKLIAQIPYRVLGDFHQGLLRVQASGRTDDAGKRLPTTYGFVDRQGKIVIEPKFMPAGEFPDDPADLPVAGLDHDWCYFDRNGKIVIRIPMGPHLNNANLFMNGRLLVKQGFTWGYQDASGNWAIPPKYNDAQNFEDGLARVQDGAKWIVIDTQGKEVKIDPKKPRRLQPYSEGLALAAENDLLGWIDSKGKLAFPLRKYEEAHKFSSGMARIKLDGMYGYLDRSGNLAIPNQYWGAGDFEHELAFVQMKDTSAYLDTKGKIVWQSKPLPKLQLK
jgi:hypothetical protein